MKKIKNQIINLILLSFVFPNLNLSQQSVEVNILEENTNSMIVEYKINTFDINALDVSGELFHQITLDEEPNFILESKPSLPHINRSFIIPDDHSIDITVIDKEYDEYENINVVPSKGNLTRNIDIATIPYVKGDMYKENKFFPGNLFELHNPYILRDFRGQVVQINPFQFNPITSKLQVYKKVVVYIEFEGENVINTFSNRTDRNKLSKDYYYIYSDRFLNFHSQQTRYSPIPEEGEMLVICYDSFCGEMNPFVEWKNQKGIKTTLVPKSSAGSSASSIKNYVQNFYNSNNLTYLLLVGDKDQIPTFNSGSGWSSGESDISYAYISGNDSYPEFFVGRFSAQNTSHVQTAVERTIQYEKYPDQNGTWYNKGLMIASNEGAGNGHDGGEADWQHAQNMRDDLLDYFYTDVDELYDGSHGGQDANGNPSDSMVRNSINSGLGIIHYTGHGDTDVWVTSNFNTGDVNALTNNNELPFVCTVGCKSGDFGDGTCLGEDFIRSTNNSEPTGAIATFMSTIYQAWEPPMEAQDEMVDILVENYSNNRKYSFGGISWNGCLKMNDAYGSAGYDETDHWTLFGDPSVSLRTTTPSTISIDHAGDYDPSEGAYEIILDGFYDNIQATLSSNGQIIGTAYGEGNFAVIALEEDVSDLESMTLTVTGYNIVPIIESIQIGQSCPGYIAGDLNGDSITNIQDIVLLVNIVLGSIDADECQAEYGDMNSDQIFNILDIVSLVSLILN